MVSMNLNPNFNVDEGSEPKFNVGAYVRAKDKDMGTGSVMAVSRVTAVDDGDKVVHQVVYTIWWMDKVHPQSGEKDVLKMHSEQSLESSARGVGKFSAQEEADAWMAQQIEGGQWVDKVQDAVDSESDVDIELRKMTEGGA